jgi:hypothetical protein
MKKVYRHWEHCEAPICTDDRTNGWQDNVVWYPSELVCMRKPYTSAQKAQNKVNRMVLKGRFKYVDRAFTYQMLSNLPTVRAGLKGLNPEKPTLLKRFKQTA